LARALGSAPTIPIGAKVRLLGPIRPRIRASEWNRRRVSSVSSASPEGRDKVAGGNAPGKRSSLPGPTLQGSQRGGTRVKLGRSPPVRATPSGSVGFPGGLPGALPPATIRCPCRAYGLAPRRRPLPTLTPFLMRVYFNARTHHPLTPSSDRSRRTLRKPLIYPKHGMLGACNHHLAARWMATRGFTRTWEIKNGVRLPASKPVLHCAGSKTWHRVVIPAAARLTAAIGDASRHPARLDQ
jgi:hypothetical protein